MASLVVDSTRGDGLLPRRFRPGGHALVVAGVTLATMRFHFGIKLAWLEVPVFAVRSVYLQNQSMRMIRNNLTEELAGLLLLAGLVLVAFSREEREDTGVRERRYRALLQASYLSVSMVALGLLFFYGIAYGVLLMALPFVQLGAFVVLFRVAQWRHPAAVGSGWIPDEVVAPQREIGTTLGR